MHVVCCRSSPSWTLTRWKWTRPVLDTPLHLSEARTTSPRSAPFPVCLPSFVRMMTQRVNTTPSSSLPSPLQLPVLPPRTVDLLPRPDRSGRRLSNQGEQVEKGVHSPRGSKVHQARGRRERRRRRTRRRTLNKKIVSLTQRHARPACVSGGA